MRLYDKIKKLLEFSSSFRNSDRKLIWEIWKEEGSVVSTGSGNHYMFYEGFMNATSPETIRRTRQRVVEDHPELQSDEPVLKEKKRIQSQKGTHVYREEFTGKLF